MIKDLVNELPNEDAALQLLGMFEMLLKKYARYLGTEDAYEELRLFFFELLEKLRRKNICTDNDGYIISYISKSVKNQYIALSKKQQSRTEDSFSDISEAQMNWIDLIAATDDETDISAYFPISNELTEHEKIILNLFFVYGYSISEIAQKFNVSRQATNQAKNHALEKIRKSLLDNPGRNKQQNSGESNV